MRFSNAEYDVVLEGVPSERDLIPQFPDVRITVTVPPEVQQYSTEIEGRISKIWGEQLRDLVMTRLARSGDKVENTAPYFTYYDRANNLRYMIQGMPLLPVSSKETRDFLKGVNSDVREVFNSYGVKLNALASGSVCICAVEGGIPGRSYPLSALGAIFQNPPTSNSNFYQVAVYFAEDVLQMDIARAITFPTNVSDVGLTSRVSWAKEITAFHWCRGRTLTFTHSGSDPSLQVGGRLTQEVCLTGDTSTIIFRKPKFFGVWTDMYHWDSDSFWTVHGGRRVIYTWLSD